jgi:hypothetical protein
VRLEQPRGAPAAGLDPDGVRQLAADLLQGALDDLGHPGRRRGAERWLSGWHSPLPAAAACELLGLDVDAVRSRLQDKLGGGGQGSG